MVVRLGKANGLEVVAQGIVREDRRDVIMSLGCELGQQGHLLGRPLPLPLPVSVDRVAGDPRVPSAE